MYVCVCTYNECMYVYESAFLLTISLHKMKISDSRSLSTGKELTDSFL